MEIIFWSLGAILNFLSPQIPSVQEWYFSRPCNKEYYKTFRHYYDYGEYLNNENNFTEEDLKNADLLKEESSLLLTDLIENPAFGPQSLSSAENSQISIAEVFYRKKDNTLSYFEYGEEKLSLIKLPEGFSLVSVNNENIIQRIYSEDNLLKEKTFWLNKNDSSSEPLKKITFEYSDSENKSLYKTIEINKSEKTSVENIYNEKGKIVSVKKFSENDEEEKLLLSEEEVSYDEENRITEKKYSEYTIEDNKSSLKFKQRYIYEYKDFAESPDEDFYENDALRVSKKNIDDKHRKVIYYFDQGFKMEVLYENDIKVSEKVFYNDKEVLR